jgi:aminoglycoside 3-N-acetyltransferase I
VDIEIRHLGPGDDGAVLAAGALFDAPPRPAATQRFLADPTHHLLIAYDAGGAPVGFVTGVETTHPDKGTETLARQRGCYGMWVGTEDGNVAARRTYERAGARATPPHVILEWDLTA